MEKWYIENLNNPNEGKYPAFEIDISSESQANICTVWYSDLFSDEAKQYALLISKAPEMLDMLKEVVQFLHKVQTPATSSIMLGNEINKLIKEATEL